MGCSQWRLAIREATEELGSLPSFEQIGEVEYRDGKFLYTTFVLLVEKDEAEEWAASVKLNWENDDAAWFALDGLPEPLHFGAKHALLAFQEFRSKNRS